MARRSAGSRDTTRPRDTDRCRHPRGRERGARTPDRSNRGARGRPRHSTSIRAVRRQSRLPSPRAAAPRAQGSRSGTSAKATSRASRRGAGVRRVGTDQIVAEGVDSCERTLAGSVAIASDRIGNGENALMERARSGYRPSAAPNNSRSLATDCTRPFTCRVSSRSEIVRGGFRSDAACSVTIEHMLPGAKSMRPRT